MTSVRPRTRVLICEDSRTYAAALQRALSYDPEIEVVGVFTTAERAIEALPKLKPHLVTMDIELPGISGLEAVERIMSSSPLPILVLSSYVGPSTTTAAAALAAGALEAIGKDDIDLVDARGPSAHALRHRVKLLAGVRVIRHPRHRLVGRKPKPPPETIRAEVVGICASTGGPQALQALLARLPADYPVPVLVVQHMSAGFTEGLARWLDGAVKPPVRLARDGEIASPGVWIAPEGAHLVLRAPRKLAFDRTTVHGLHKPSADVLLASIAKVVGSEGVGVVLTGMGRDGAVGLQTLRAAGGLTIAQDAETSVVYGMPKAAAELGAQHILSLDAIGEALLAVVAGGRARS